MIGRLLSVSGFTALSRFAGFFRDVLMAAVLGAGPASDAFVVALRIPNQFRAFFGEGAFHAAFVPRYTVAATAGGTAAGSPAARLADDVFAWQLVAQLVILLVAFVAMRGIITVLAPGFVDDPAQMDLAITLTRITFPYLICIVVVAQLSAMVNSIGRFRAAAATPIFLNIAMIGALLAAPYFPSAAYAAAYGVLFGGILELLFMLWMAARAGLVLRFTWPRWTPKIREFLKALAAASVGAGGGQIALVLDTIIASFLPRGDLTALYYADRINQLPIGIIGVALGVVLLPEMSARIAARDEAGASRSQNRAVVFGLLLTLPCVAAYFIMPDTIMRAIFMRGAFDAAAAETAAGALLAYGVGLPAFVLMRCVIQSFYARHDTLTPVRAILFGVGANIAMKIVLVWGFSLGIAGLAFGTSFGLWVNLAVLTYLARRRGVLVATTDLRLGVIPVLAATAAAALGVLAASVLGPVWIAPGAWFDEGVLLLAMALGGGAYGVAVLAFRRRLPLLRDRAGMTQ